MAQLFGDCYRKKILVDFDFDSHVLRAEFLAECGSEPVGSAFVRVVEADLHGGVESLDFGLDDVCIGAFLRARGVVEDSDVCVADFAV